MEDAEAASSGGFEDRADVGVEVGAPEGSEAVGDLAEDDAGPQRLFRPAVLSMLPPVPTMLRDQTTSAPRR
jgi:hypothetical protein